MDELEFEHVGTLRCGERLLICDVEYLPGRFAGMCRGPVALDLELEVEPGVWQLLIARAPDDDPREDPPRFVLLTHDRELEVASPLERAEAVALLRVDSGRITAIDPSLRDDPIIQTAAQGVGREQLPCMLRAPGVDEGVGVESDPRGALVDLDLAGVFELHATPGRPRTAVFLVVAED